MPAWRSIVSARSSASALVLTLLALVALSSAATAQERRIGVAPIEGPTGKKVEAELVKAVRKSGELVSPAAYDAAAKKLFALTRKPEDVAAVASELNLQVVITGKVKKGDDGWELAVSVRHGPTGKSGVKLKYPLSGPKVDAATLKKVVADVTPAIETATMGPGSGEGAEGPDSPSAPGDVGPANGDDSERPLDSGNSGGGGASGPRRPDWAPFVDASLSLLLAGRSFNFDEQGTPSFHSTITPGVRFDATAYPLAMLSTRPGNDWNAVTGLGVGLTYDTMVWKPSIPCYPAPTGGCSPTVDAYGTAEYRLEAGVRWRWNILKKSVLGPELLAQLQYGVHNFTIQKRQYLSDTDAMGKPHAKDVGPPDVSYNYLTIGLGARLPVIARLAFFVDLNIHVPFDVGAIQTAEEWGPGSAFGFRVSGGGDVKIWQGIYARVSGYYEDFVLSFNQPPGKHNIMPPCPCGTTGGASDGFYGITIGAGYQY